MPVPEPDPAADVQAAFCATLVDEWVRAGLTDAVVAPGSRSTPLAVALADRHEIDVHVHLDERSAGFVALGLGLATGRPAVVLTTSGTAAVELHPAVVEADLAGVPMLAVTANRPPELHDIAAPQTVDQDRLFGRSSRWFAAPGPPDAAARSAWRSLAARAALEATSGPNGPGPVHLDLAFREPLLGTPAELPAGRPDGSAWHTSGGRRLALDRSGTDRLGALLDADRGVIVVGAGGGESGAVLALAEATGWPVLADARSGCRLPHPAVVAHADAILRSAELSSALRPDVVLRLGAPPASKVVAAWLATSGARQVAVVGSGRWMDPDRSADHVVRAEPTAVCAALSRVVARSSSPGWAGRWTAAEQAASDAVERWLGEHAAAGTLTEPGVARAVVQAVAALGPSEPTPATRQEASSPAPHSGVVVVSSSMPVRDVEWYGGTAPGVRVLANRGANGIDGVVSTAVGVALAARGTGYPTVVLVGDVAFLHDTNALLGLLDRGVDLTVVVVDNDGGGIFSFLPQADALAADRFEELFGTPHGVDLALLAAAHGLVTIEAHGPDDVDAALAAALGGGVQVVRVRTDRTANVEHHEALHAAVGEAVRGVVRDG